MSQYIKDPEELSTCSRVLEDHGLSINSLPEVEPESPTFRGKDLMVLKLKDSVHAELKSSVLNYLEDKPPIGFMDQLKGLPDARLKHYLGRGVTYNPHFQPWIEPEFQVMGIARPNVGNLFQTEYGQRFYNFLIDQSLIGSFFELMKSGAQFAREQILARQEFHHPSVDEALELFDWNAPEHNRLFKNFNSYSDSWGFNTLTDLGRLAPLRHLIDSTGLSPVRSRVAVLKSSVMSEEDFNVGWHTDENFFLELRTYIPLQSSDNYFLEIQGLGEVPVKPGYAYIWDTKVPHRPGAYERSDLDRYSLILGLNPWFTFTPQKTWEPNRFFKRHPFDIFFELTQKPDSIFEGFDLISPR